MNGDQELGWYFAHAQNDVNLRILGMFKPFFAWRSLKVMVYSVTLGLMVLDTHGRFSMSLYKGENFGDILFAILHTKPLWKGLYSCFIQC